MPFIANLLSLVNMLLLGPFVREGGGKSRAAECSFQLKKERKKEK